MIRQLPLWSDSNTEMLKRPQRTAFCTREAQSYRSLEFVLLSLCPGLSSTLLIRQKFNVVIVDEAGQISHPAIIGAMAADTFVLVGDHEQLPPLVQSDIAEKAGKR